MDRRFLDPLPIGLLRREAKQLIVARRPPVGRDLQPLVIGIEAHPEPPP
jgi:hypothetical protein